MHARIPYVFMTNGGAGRTESEYIAEIVKKLTDAESGVSETSAMFGKHRKKFSGVIV